MEKKNYVAKKQTISARSHKALDEWQILINLNHKNIVGTKECFYDERASVLTMVMELCDGECFILFQSVPCFVDQHF